VSLLPRPSVLVGREELLAGLQVLLTEGERPRTAVLCGLGGVGKTSLATEYAHQHLGELGIAWQVAAEDQTVLTENMANLATQLSVRELADPRDPVASVHAVLAAFPGEWLLVFDNALGEASVRPFLPPAGRGRILITSQSSHWRGGPVLDVPVLDQEEAAQFLIRTSGDADDAAARDLAMELGGLPLALEQAAGYVRATATTLAGYMTLFGDRRDVLLDRGEPVGHPETVAGTLGLALARLDADAPGAAKLLRLLACLAPEPVPIALLLAELGTASELDPAVAAMLAPLLGDQLAVGEAVAAVRRYSLVSPAGDGLVLVHRLVQSVIRAQLTVDEHRDWTATAIRLVERAFPVQPAEPTCWPVCARLLPHVMAATTNTGGAETAPKETGDLCQRAAGYLIAIRAQQEPALELLSQALLLRTRAYGRESHQVTETLISSAQVLHNLGRVVQALEPASEAVAIMQRTGSPGLAPALRMFANVLVEADRVAESVSALEQALTICEAMPSGPHHATGEVLAMLGYALWRGGDWTTARDTLIKALAAYDAAGPQSPTDRVTAIRRLGQVLQDLGDLPAARIRMNEANALALKYFGADGVETVRAENALGHVLAMQGDLDEAERLQRHAVEFFTTTHPAWPLREESLILLAKTLVMAGKADEALQAARQALESCEHHRGPDHPYNAVALRAVGAAEHAKGDLDAARASLDNALAIYERTHGTDYPPALAIREELARVIKEQHERNVADPAEKASSPTGLGA
jgi:tetratricopeptide (TPR) repeat protein